MTPRYLPVLTLTLASAIVAGCSGGAPTIPADPHDVAFSKSVAPMCAVGRNLWGIWEIEIDPADGTATIIPLRFGSFHANVRQFLEGHPCTDCLRIVPPIVPTDYGMDVDIALRHPFPGNGYYHGFDVRGIVMLEGTYLFPWFLHLTTRAATGEWALLNPDGWTRIFNAQDYTLPGILGYSRGKMIPPSWPDPANTLNAFKAYYSEGQSEEEGGRRAFFAGDEVVRTYQLQLVDGEPFRFWYAMDASWEPPEGAPPYDIEDFPISANCPEAYRFDFSVVSGELYADGGSVTIGIDVWDHQGWEPPYWLALDCPEIECPDHITTSPLYVDGERAHWEIEVEHSSGTLDPDVGTELLIACVNRDDDPFTGDIHGLGRFTIPVSLSGCNDSLHSNYLGTGDYTSRSHPPALEACFVHDTGQPADGEYLGYLGAVSPIDVRTYIVDTTTPVNGAGLGSGWDGCKPAGVTPVSIDISEELGRFFVVWNDNFSHVEEWTYDGIMLNSIDASNNGMVFCLDTDGSGGWWNGYFPEIGFACGIKHFVPSASMSFVEVPEDHISLPETWGTPCEVICIPGETLLVLTGYPQGKVRAYDITSSPPVYIDEITEIFSGDLDFGTFPDKPCDMVADQTVPNLAHCRIVIWGNLQSGGGELVKIDSDLNIWSGPVSVEGHYDSIDMNPDVGHIILWPTRSSPCGGPYALVEYPNGW